MSKHVHVRLTQALSVSEEGELIEMSHCQCGAMWTKKYQEEDGDSEQ